MSLYEPLNEPVPSLETVSGNAPPVEVTVSKSTAEEKKIAASQQVVSYAVVTPVPAERPTRCLLTSCCCGCSLSTGVLLISWLEAISWGFTFVGAVLSLYIKTQEKKIDHAIVKADADQQAENTDESPTDAPSEPTTEEKVNQTNMAIDIAAISAPFLIVMAFIGMYFCVKGMKAANEGNIDAAKSYMWWKRITVCWAFVELIFGISGGPVFGFISFMVAVYYFLVVRSYYLQLVRSREAAEETPQVAV